MRPFTIQPLECDVFLKDHIYKIQYSLNIITIIIWRLLFKTFHSELCSYFHIFVYIAVFSKEWINPHKKPIKTQHELQGCCSLIKLHITSECKHRTSCYTTAVQAAVLDTFWLVRPAGVKDHFVLIAQTYTHPLVTATVHKRASLNTQRIKPWRRWARAAYKDTWCH